MKDSVLINCTLEGLESSYDSPGLDTFRGVCGELPEKGERFVFLDDDKGILITGTVISVRHFSPAKIGFKTNRTTYILYPEIVEHV